MRFLLLIPLLLFGCTTSTQETAALKPPVSEIFDTYYKERLRFNPLEATAAGLNLYSDSLPVFLSEDYQTRAAMFYQQYLDTLKHYPAADLSGNDPIYRDVMEWECRMRLEGLQKDPALIITPMFGMPAIEFTPVSQIMSFHLYISQLAGGGGPVPFETTEDYYNWLSRLEDYVSWLAKAKDKMREGMDKGFVWPEVIVERVISQLAPLIDTPVRQHIFYKPVLSLPNDLPPIEHEVLPSEYENFIAKELIPAFRDLRSFLETEYLPSAVETTGIGELPDGPEIYEYLVRFHTTTNMSADEIFDLGMAEVERISAEMEKVKNEIGFAGTLKEFFTFIRNNPELRPYTNADQVIAHFGEIHERMKPHLSRLFNMVPKGSFEVRRTEAFREASASAEYNVGSKDGSRPGIFYVPVPDPEDYIVIGDESLFLHEAIPGHHYQLSLQQENEEIPEFMHAEGLGVFVEGWALYAESLGRELGLYEDPYQYFGMLSAEMHRAIRLVVDAGMHAKGWSREEAIRFSLDHEAESEAAITAEIERYMVNPGQALSYKIGQLKILELREYASNALGQDFDIREFHDQVLSTGSLPLVLLEKKIKSWVEQQKTNG